MQNSKVTKNKIDKSGLFGMPTSKIVRDLNFMNWQHENKSCIICNKKPIEVHHVLGRNKATRDDLTVPLCVTHHRSEKGVHGRDSSEVYSVISKEEMQEIAENNYQEFKELL